MTSTSFELLKKAHLTHTLSGLSDVGIRELLKNYPKDNPLFKAEKAEDMIGTIQYGHERNPSVPFRKHVADHMAKMLRSEGLLTSDFPFDIETFTPKDFSEGKRLEFIYRFYALSFQRLKHPERIAALKLIFPRYDELINSIIYKTEIEPAIQQLKGWRDDGVNTPERRTVVALLKKFYGAASVTTRGNWVAQQLAKINAQ